MTGQPESTEMRGWRTGYDIGITGGVTAMPEFQKLFFPNVLQHVNAVDTNPYCKVTPAPSNAPGPVSKTLFENKH